VMSHPAMTLGLRFCASREGWTGGVWPRFQRWAEYNLAVSGHGSSKYLVGTISLLSCTNGLKNRFLAI